MPTRRHKNRHRSRVFEGPGHDRFNGSGDPYLWLAKRVGAVPQDATKATQGIREQYKIAIGLGVGYGMQAETLGTRIRQSKFHAAELLPQHDQTFPQFWRWSDGILIGR